MPRRSQRVQVTVDPELARALAEFGAGAPRSRSVRDLAIRGARALREEHHRRRKALELLGRIADGHDERYDLTVSAQLHAQRR